MERDISVQVRSTFHIVDLLHSEEVSEYSESHLKR